MNKHIETPTIGEILNEEFLFLGFKIFFMTTVDTSLRLAKFFGVSDDYFISLQDDIDIRNMKIELAEELEKIKTFVPV